jgi:hypothetical protein
MHCMRAALSGVEKLVTGFVAFVKKDIQQLKFSLGVL